MRPEGATPQEDVYGFTKDRKEPEIPVGNLSAAVADYFGLYDLYLSDYHAGGISVL